MKIIELIRLVLVQMTLLCCVSGCEQETTITQFLEPEVDVIITPEDVESSSLRDIVNSHNEGTRFLIKGGIYRMQTISPKRGMVFYGDVDTNGNRYTILNGSRLLEDFQQDRGLYFVTGQDQEGATNGKTETGWEGSVHPEDLFFDDVALKQVLTKSEVTTDTWYFDYENDTIWFANDPSGHKVETSVTPFAFHETHNATTASRVTIKGFIVEKYANKAQKGAIGGEGLNEQWYVAYNETRLNHGTGIFVAANSKVMYNYSHHNGELGMKSGAGGSLFQGNEISYNNTQHFKPGWGGGGAKFAALDDLVFKDNYSHHNYGRGLWIDIGCHNITIDNNLITHNYNEGIFYEISYTGTIINNKLAHNGQDSEWLFGGGIVLSSSTDVDVIGNKVIVNADYGNGITFFWSDRHLSFAKVGHTPPLRVENINIENNDITYLGVLNKQNNKTPVSGAIAGLGVDEWSASGTINNVEPVAFVVVHDVTVIDPRLINKYINNSYHVPDLSEKWFIWGQSASRISWDDFRSSGNDISGSIDTNVVDDSSTWSWRIPANFDLFLAEVEWW